MALVRRWSGDPVGTNQFAPHGIRDTPVHRIVGIFPTNFRLHIRGHGFIRVQLLIVIVEPGECILDLQYGLLMQHILVLVGLKPNNFTMRITKI